MSLFFAKLYVAVDKEIWMIRKNHLAPLVNNKFGYSFA